MLELLTAASDYGKPIVNIVSVKTFAITKEKPLPPVITVVKVFAIKQEEASE